MIRTLFIPGALHGNEASFLADICLRKLRTAIFRAVWSGRQPLANTGAVLCLIDGPSGCDPAFCVIWFGFRMLRRYLAYRPGEVDRDAADGCFGHGPAHLLVESAAKVGFLLALGGCGPGLIVLSNFGGPIQHFRAAVFEARRNKVTADLCARKGFRGGPFLHINGTLQLFCSNHVRGRDKALLLKGVLAGGVWNGFLSGSMYVVGSVAVLIMRIVLFRLLVESRAHPKFFDLLGMDKSCWPRCLLWHGWLPLLSGVNGGSPRAESPGEGACNLLECALGPETSGYLDVWQLPVGFDAEGAAERVAAEPDVCTDGSLVKVSGASSSGSVFSTHHPGGLWAHRRWGHLDDDIWWSQGHWVFLWFLFCAWSFADCSNGGVLGVIFALQAADGIHLGVDNLGVVRHVGRLLDGNVGPRPAEPREGW